MRLTPLLAVFVLVPVQALAQAGGRSDQEVIQGTWKSASGDAVAVFGTPGPTLQFADTKAEIVNSEGNTEKTGRFEIFQGANPPEIAFTLLDVATNKKNRDAFKRLVAVCAEHGWGEYRTAPVYQDAVMDTYSFNNHALRRFNETIKDAIDPNGILSAGRYGIWPKHLRKA